MSLSSTVRRRDPGAPPGRRPVAGRRRSPVIGCEEAQEAISARLDQEWHRAVGAALDGHLVNCQACRVFKADAAGLGRRARLRSPSPCPGLLATLTPLLEPGRRTLLASARVAPPLRPGSGWARTVRWAGAMVPAVVVLVAFPLGVGSQPRLVPTRPPSACTLGLVARHWAGGG